MRWGVLRRVGQGEVWGVQQTVDIGDCRLIGKECRVETQHRTDVSRNPSTRGIPPALRNVASKIGCQDYCAKLHEMRFEKFE